MGNEEKIQLIPCTNAENENRLNQINRNMLNQNKNNEKNKNKEEPNILNIPSNDKINKSPNNKAKTKKNYKCTYDKKELLSKLNLFLNQIDIQDTSSNAKNKLHDSVFELIQKDEISKLLQFFNVTKNNFLKEILNYLNYHKANISQNLTFQLLNEENASQVYRNKIQNEISIIGNDKKSFQINYLTIMLLGKSGVGKTTLINKILGVNAPTGDGNFITTETTPYQSEKMPFLRLVDTRGIELSVNFGALQLEKEATKFIQRQLETTDINNFVHCIWYCITGKRFEAVEVKILKGIRDYYKGNKIPIIIVYTQSTDKKTIINMKEYILKQIDCNDFVYILADDIEAVDGTVIKSFGVEELLSQTLFKCKEALKGDMRSVMTNQISTKIESNLRNENSEIRNFIFEKKILNLIKGYSAKSDEDFQKEIINFYEFSIAYFLNKKISEQSFQLIKNTEIINNNCNTFINFYHQKTKDIISNQLKPLAFELLNTQAEKEQEKGKPTLIQNKRNLNDFIASNKKFLEDKFFGLSQIYYIGKFIEYSLEPLTKTFEDILNSSICNLIKEKEIKILIDKCYLQKYNEFEERIKSFNPKIIINQKEITVNYSNISDGTQINKVKSMPNNNYKKLKTLSDTESIVTIPLSMPMKNSSSNVFKINGINNLNSKVNNNLYGNNNFKFNNINYKHTNGNIITNNFNNKYNNNMPIMEYPNTQNKLNKNINYPNSFMIKTNNNFQQNYYNNMNFNKI